MTDTLTSGAPQAEDRAAPEWMRRRTFAIIAHPDAGKTTLTERLLYEAGAIRLAGDVKARGERRRTQSDWMELEQKRGISVTSSVMTFEKDGVTFNLLDTPGHQDFSEDTYRTLTAVDSAVMVIDAAKGIESQTLKLLEVCRLRDIPIITFINKIDRESRDPFELLDEIESTLALDLAPVAWPLGMGVDFHGVYDLLANTLERSTTARGANCNSRIAAAGPDDPAFDKFAPEGIVQSFRENVDLAASAYPPLDAKAYREGHLSPVVFGSALRDYGVAPLLRLLADVAPPPRPQPAEPKPVKADDPFVSGFVFKVQANMDPNHRDRVAFVRLCSGKFRRGMKLRQSRNGRTIAVQNPIFFFARERELTEEAFPGDIIGIPNHGTLRVGDSLSDGPEVTFTGIPNFAPEILRRVRLDDPMRAKQLGRALEDMAEEGVTQLFRPQIGSQAIVGVVGQLQLDVLEARLAAEYNIAAGFEPTTFSLARWVSSDDPKELKKFAERMRMSMADDRDHAPVFLANSQWDLDYAVKNWPAIRFANVRERA